MNKQAAKDFLYGGIMEIIRNPTHYYNSGVGSSYSHFTELGKTAVFEYVTSMAHIMTVCAAEEIDTHAKDLIMKGLTST